VQFTTGYRHTFDWATLAIVVSGDDRVRDSALERGCEAVQSPGEADFELFDVPGYSPWFLEINLPRQTPIAGKIPCLI
jgi:hypothetical protein